MMEDVERILEWPRETRSPEEHRRLIEHRTALHRDLVALADKAEREDRNFTVEEAEEFDRMQAEFDRLRSEVPSR
jgi:hypothetical protein